VGRNAEGDGDEREEGRPLRQIPTRGKPLPEGRGQESPANLYYGLIVTTITASPRLAASVRSVSVLIRDASIECRSTRYDLAFSAR
jgi:hypothetical protein